MIDCCLRDDSVNDNEHKFQLHKKKITGMSTQEG